MDPETKFISGKNTIRFRMLKDGTRIQLDLNDYAQRRQNSLWRHATEVRARTGAVFVDFPETLQSRRNLFDRFLLLGQPGAHVGRFGAFTFAQGSVRPPVDQHRVRGNRREPVVAQQGPVARRSGEHAISAWPIPNGLVDVSNGKFMGKTDLGDGYTRWDWLVHYPINNYDVSLNIGNYEHFSDQLGDLPLDFYVLPEDLDKAKKQFAQAKGMLEAYQHYFGEYPFMKDGYKLIEVPYSGMEHQSAVTYGNHFANGYLERDWTGVGISPRFDFIIIHESAHEWFGNSITAADESDMWIHEGWATYLESLYVEYMYGHDDALKYINGYKSKVKNDQPIVTQRGAKRHPAPGYVFQRGAVHQHAAQHRERRQSLVAADPRFLPAFQVSEHHDRGYRTILQREDRNEFDAGFRAVPAPHGDPHARTQIQRRCRQRRISLES